MSTHQPMVKPSNSINPRHGHGKPNPDWSFHNFIKKIFGIHVIKIKDKLYYNFGYNFIINYNIYEIFSSYKILFVMNFK